MSARDITVRSLSAGITAMVFGLVLVGTGKIDLNWALYLGLGGVVGYWGQEALGWLVQLVQLKGGQLAGLPPQPSPPSEQEEPKP